MASDETESGQRPGEILEGIQLPSFFMEFEWQGQVHPDRLAKLAQQLPASRRIVKKALPDASVAYLLWSSATERLDDQKYRQQANEVLQAELRLINGAWLGVDGLNGPTRMQPKGVVWLTDAFGGIPVTIDAKPAWLNPQMSSYWKLSGDAGRAEEISEWLKLAEESDRVRTGLRMLSSDKLDWYDLWKLFELARTMVAGGRQSERLWESDPAFVKREDYWRFHVAAHDPAISGDDARHAERTIPKKERLDALLNPMSLREAQSWVLKLWRRVMIRAKKNPSNCHLTSPKPPVRRVYDPDSKGGTLIVQQFDTDLDIEWGDGSEYARKILAHESERRKREKGQGDGD